MTAPNYSLELEQRVLETLMHFGVHNHSRVQKAMLMLTTDCFYIPVNAVLFGMIRECFKTESPFNFVDVLVLIPKDSNELHQALTWIIDNYGKFHAGESEFEHDIERLLLLMRLRKQVQLSEQMLKDVKSCPNPEAAQDILIASLQEISSISFKESNHGISNIELSEDYYDGKLEADLLHPTTSELLNQLLGGGIMSKSFITIAAGAGVGKTGFSIYLLDALARMQPNTQTLFFSLEMEAKHIWNRHVGICGGKQFDKLTDTERMLAIKEVMKLPMQIYDSSSCKSACDIDFITTTARLRAMNKPISVIVVDYLGLVEIKGSYESNALKQTEITSRLARLALELDSIVIALSQVNRSPSARATDDRCPYPSDASGSSGSYFSSTLWLGVDRPELYQDDPMYRNQFVVKCRKNRFGGSFEYILAFNEGTFSEMPVGWFKKPTFESKPIEKSIFKGYSKDFYSNS